MPVSDETMLAIRECLLVEVGIGTSYEKNKNRLQYAGAACFWYFLVNDEKLIVVAKPRAFFNPIECEANSKIRSLSLGDPGVFKVAQEFIMEIEHPRLWAQRRALQKRRNSSSPSGTAS